MPIRHKLSIAVALTVAHPAAAQQHADTATIRTVTIDGHAVRVQVAGLERRRPGEPIVVFEAGATNALEVWRHVLPSVAARAPVVAYDRAGLGRSEWDSVPPTPEHVAGRLHRLLQAIGAGPPYVLVGFSWGGVLVRYFAGYHPESIAGLVLVDPGPIVTATLAEELAPFDSIGAGRAGYEAYWAATANLLRRAPPAAQAELTVLRRLMELEPAERGLRPLPEVPVVVLLAGKYLPLPLEVSFDLRAHFEVNLRHRVRHLQEWALASPEGAVVVSRRSTHAMPREEPGLIVWAIERVLAARAPRPGSPR